MTTKLLEPSCTVTVAGVPRTPRSGFVALDETKEYATCQVEIPILTDGDVDLIDPRDGDRIQITLTGRPFDLGVRTRAVSHDKKFVTVDGASDEALLAEYSPLADIDLTAHAGNIRTLVNAVLAIVLPGTALESLPNPTGAISELDALVWKAGTTAWAFLVPLTGSLSLRLFCDEQRRWYLVPTAHLVDGVVSAMASNSREGTDTLSRDGDAWATGVVIRYRWTDAGVAHEEIDAAGVAGKVDVIDRDTPYPGPGLAAARLKRLQGQGRSMSATSIATYAETPGMEARFTLPGADDQVGRLQRVEWPLLDGYAQLTARELTEVADDAYLYGPDDITFDDIPDSMTYDTFDWSAI